MKNFNIGNLVVGEKSAPIIIAEMSGNHNESLDRAINIVEEAAKSGAHMLKLQTYTADTMTIDSNNKDFNIQDPKSPWKGDNLYKLYKKAYTPWEWHKSIISRANELGMECFSTPFDISAVNFLEELKVPAYKIASFENNDLALIKKVASTGKPIIISTGMASLSDLQEMVEAIRSEGNEKIVLLKCTSNYPASPKSSNLKTIPHMKSLFDTFVGLSDHTLGVGVSIAAISLRSKYYRETFYTQ